MLIKIGSLTIFPCAKSCYNKQCSFYLYCCGSFVWDFIVLPGEHWLYFLEEGSLGHGADISRWREEFIHSLRTSEASKWKIFLSSTVGRLSPKVVFHQRLSSTKSRLPPKVVFHQRSSSTEGHLQLKVVFHQRASSTKGPLPLKVIFHRWLSFTYHNTLVDLIFVRTVNRWNLSLLPCLEVA